MKLAFQTTNTDPFSMRDKLLNLKGQEDIRPFTAINLFCRYHCPHLKDRTASEAYYCHHEGCPFGIIKESLTRKQQESILKGSVTLEIVDPYMEYPQEDSSDSNAVATQNNSIVEKLKGIFGTKIENN